MRSGAYLNGQNMWALRARTTSYAVGSSLGDVHSRAHKPENSRKSSGSLVGLDCGLNDVCMRARHVYRCAVLCCVVGMDLNWLDGRRIQAWVLQWCGWMAQNPYFSVSAKTAFQSLLSIRLQKILRFILLCCACCPTNTKVPLLYRPRTDGPFKNHTIHLNKRE